MECILQFSIVVASLQAVMYKHFCKNVVMRNFVGPFARHSSRSQHAEWVTLSIPTAASKPLLQVDPFREANH